MGFPGLPIILLGPNDLFRCMLCVLQQGICQIVVTRDSAAFQSRYDLEHLKSESNAAMAVLLNFLA
jgi:hypothetical protein